MMETQLLSSHCISKGFHFKGYFELLAQGFHPGDASRFVGGDSRRVKDLILAHIFPWAPKIPVRPKSFPVRTTQDIPPEAMKGSGGQSFLSQLELRDQVKREKPVI